MGDIIAKGLAAKALEQNKQLSSQLVEKASKLELNSISSQLSESTKNIRAESFKITPNSSKKAVLTIIDDDGRIEALTELKPMLDVRGMKAGTAIVTSYVGASPLYMNWDQIAELSGAGWEVMSHTVGHYNLSTLDVSQQEFQIKQALETLKGKGYSAKGFVYPFSGNDENTRRLVNQYHIHSYGGAGTADSPVDSTYIVRRTIGENDTFTLDTFKNWLDQAIANKQWLVICTHIGALSATHKQILVDFLDYAKTKIDLKQLTNLLPSEAYEIFGNVIESRNYKTNEFFAVTKTGEAFGTGIYRDYRIISSAFTAETPITEYTPGQTSIKSYLAAANSGFPNTSAGTAITYRHINNDGLSYQEWYTTDSSIYYRRSWNSANKTWNSFVMFGASFYRIVSTDLKATNPITDFAKNQFTVRSYTVAEAGGYPSSAGTATTFRHALNDSLSYQEWQTTDGAVQYRRTWNTTNNTWNPWYPIGSLIQSNNSNPTGTFQDGQLAYDTYKLAPYAFKYLNNGTWFKFGQRRVLLSNSTNRPTLESGGDVGYMYLDTQLSPNGKPIWWNGSVWVDATGAIV